MAMSERLKMPLQPKPTKTRQTTEVDSEKQFNVIRDKSEEEKAKKKLYILLQFVSNAIEADKYGQTFSRSSKWILSSSSSASFCAEVTHNGLAQWTIWAQFKFYFATRRNDQKQQQNLRWLIIFFIFDFMFFRRFDCLLTTNKKILAHFVCVLFIAFVVSRTNRKFAYEISKRMSLTTIERESTCFFRSYFSCGRRRHLRQNKKKQGEKITQKQK